MKMFKKVANTSKMTRAEWLKCRQKLGIGGSEMASVLGYNKWASALDVWLDKTAKQIDINEGNEFTHWGNTLEPIIAEEFERVTGKKVRRNNYILQSIKYPWLFANIDRELVGINEGLEIKTAIEYKMGEWEGDNVPTNYYIQCQHYMAVTGWQRWWIAVLIGGHHFEYKCIERNEADIQLIVEEGKKFWDMVQNNIMPAVDGSESATKALQGMYKEVKADIVDLPFEASNYIADYEKAKENKALWTEQEKLAKNQLCALLGHSESGISGKYQVFWKPTKGRSSFDTKTLKKEHPELIEKYTKMSEGSRRFSIKVIA